MGTLMGTYLDLSPLCIYTVDLFHVRYKLGDKMFNKKSLLIAVVVISFPLNSFAQCQRRIAPPQPEAAARVVEEQVVVYPEVTYEELATLVKEKKAFLVDANKKETYKNGHIPGAISFVKAQKKLAKKLPKEKDALIVVYCGSVECHAWESAVKEISALSYTNVKHFPGGIKGWKEAGGETK